MGENSKLVNLPFCEYFFTKILPFLNFMTDGYL